MNAALDEVRAAEARRMIQDGYEPVLKKSRWRLLKRPNNLTDNQRLKLRDVLRYNLKSVRAYLLKEEFQYFWGYDSPTWAEKFLDRWCADVMRSRIEPMGPRPATEEIRPHDARPPGTSAQLLPGTKGVLQRCYRGAQQQS